MPYAERTKRDIMTLARDLKLPKAVMAPLERAASALPGLPLDGLSSPKEAASAWERTRDLLGSWEEDDGMTHLAAALAAACRTRELYRRCYIPEYVFWATMGCFGRFLQETRDLIGRWAFDRGFWTWRQTGGLLFRLGTLEYEYATAGPGPRPGGLSPEDPVLSVHIPSDAVLTRKKLDLSYVRAGRFFDKAGGPICWRGKPKAIICHSWLLAPALDELLPEDSGIRRFAGSYVRYSVREEDTAFYRWLFGTLEQTPAEDLPERTSLQRAAKAHLAAGGHIGAAHGMLSAAVW